MDHSKITGWMFSLEGAEDDLENLCVYLQGSPTTVVKHEGEFYLRLDCSDVGFVPVDVVNEHGH